MRCSSEAKGPRLQLATDRIRPLSAIDFITMPVSWFGEGELSVVDHHAERQAIQDARMP